MNAVLLASVSNSDKAWFSNAASNPLTAPGGAPQPPLTELEGRTAEVVRARERIPDLATGARQGTLDQIPRS